MVEVEIATTYSNTLGSWETFKSHRTFFSRRTRKTRWTISSYRTSHTFIALFYFKHAFRNHCWSTRFSLWTCCTRNAIFSLVIGNTRYSNDFLLHIKILILLNYKFLVRAGKVIYVPLDILSKPHYFNSNDLNSNNLINLCEFFLSKYFFEIRKIK